MAKKPTFNQHRKSILVNNGKVVIICGFIALFIGLISDVTHPILELALSLLLIISGVLLYTSGNKIK